jgi:hypothetical protein
MSSPCMQPAGTVWAAGAQESHGTERSNDVWAAGQPRYGEIERDGGIELVFVQPLNEPLCNMGGGIVRKFN